MGGISDLHNRCKNKRIRSGSRVRFWPPQKRSRNGSGAACGQTRKRIRIRSPNGSGPGSGSGAQTDPKKRIRNGSQTDPERLDTKLAVVFSFFNGFFVIVTTSVFYSTTRYLVIFSTLYQTFNYVFQCTHCR